MQRISKNTDTDYIYYSPDYTKIKKCSACENSNRKGICKFFMLYAHLRNGCLRDQEAADE